MFDKRNRNILHVAYCNLKGRLALNCLNVNRLRGLYRENEFTNPIYYNTTPAVSFTNVKILETLVLRNTLRNNISRMRFGEGEYSCNGKILAPKK